MPLPASAVMRHHLSVDFFFFFLSLNFTLKLNVLNMRPVVWIRIEGGRGRDKSVVTQLLKIPTRDAIYIPRNLDDPAGRTRNDLQSLGRNFTTPSTRGVGDILNGRGKTCAFVLTDERVAAQRFAASRGSQSKHGERVLRDRIRKALAPLPRLNKSALFFIFFFVSLYGTLGSLECFICLRHRVSDGGARLFLIG